MILRNMKTGANSRKVHNSFCHQEAIWFYSFPSEILHFQGHLKITLPGSNPGDGVEISSFPDGPISCQDNSLKRIKKYLYLIFRP